MNHIFCINLVCVFPIYFSGFKGCSVEFSKERLKNWRKLDSTTDFSYDRCGLQTDEPINGRTTADDVSDSNVSTSSSNDGK